MSNRKTFAYVCLFYLIHFMTMGVYTPYVNVYYEKIGFNGSQIGLIVSIGLVFGMLFAPLWGVLSDKTQKYRSIIGILMLGAAISIFFWSLQKEYLAVMVTSIFLVIFRADIGSLSDSLSVQYCNNNGFDFGFVRSIGSLGYLIGSFVVANVLNAFGFSGPYVYIYMLLMFMGALLLFKFPTNKSVVDQEAFNFKKDMKDLFKNKDFIYINIIMFFSMVLIDSAGGYCGNHLVSTLKQNEAMIGIYSCAMVLPEVFIVMNAKHLFRKFGFKRFYLVATITQVIRCLGYALSGNVLIFLILSTFHGIMIVAGCVGNINFLHKSLSSKVLASAMSVYSAIYTVGSALFSQVFGIIYEYLGSNMIFMLVGVLSLIPVVMILCSKRFDKMDNQII